MSIRKIFGFLFPNCAYRFLSRVPQTHPVHIKHFFAEEPTHLQKATEITPEEKRIVGAPQVTWRKRGFRQGGGPGDTKWGQTPVAAEIEGIRLHLSVSNTCQGHHKHCMNRGQNAVSLGPTARVSCQQHLWGPSRRNSGRGIERIH